MINLVHVKINWKIASDPQEAARSCRLADAWRSSCMCIIFGLYCNRLTVYSWQQSLFRSSKYASKDRVELYNVTKWPDSIYGLPTSEESEWVSEWVSERVIHDQEEVKSNYAWKDASPPPKKYSRWFTNVNHTLFSVSCNHRHPTCHDFDLCWAFLFWSTCIYVMPP